MLFFFKQKTAYEMRISDWSSDVCSSDLRVAGDVERAQEVVAAGLQVLALQLVLVGIGDGMDQEVELAPGLLDGGEDGIDGGVVGDVAGQHHLGADRFGQRAHPPLQGLALEGECEFGALFACRSEEHTSELQSLMRISYAVFCLKNK